MMRKSYPFGSWALGLAAVLPLTLIPRYGSQWLGVFAPIAENQLFLPVLWSVLLVLYFFFAPRLHVPGRLRHRGTVYAHALLGACAIVAVRFVLGMLMSGIAYNPYDRSPLGIVYNLARALPVALGIETVRAYLMGYVYHKRGRWGRWAIVIAVAFALVQVNYRQLQVVQSAQSAVIFLATDVAPALSQSALCTVLTLFGGPWASVLYVGLVSLVEYTFPVLPSLSWLAESACYIIVPASVALVAVEKQQRLLRIGTLTPEKATPGYAALLAASVVFLWFVVGVFPVYPSVILTGSMEPLIQPGDVVLVEKITTEEEVYLLKADDIINFSRGDIVITHRIVDILRDEAGNIQFVTKGDNNGIADSELLDPNNIKGRVRYWVPKAGLPVLVMRSAQPAPEGVLTGE